LKNDWDREIESFQAFRHLANLPTQIGGAGFHLPLGTAEEFDDSLAVTMAAKY
tara:strand:- start:249 stop:407 length:159 start_codon:yes stop_codon:yes gene_type:complete